jgi:hypothetical protein
VRGQVGTDLVAGPGGRVPTKISLVTAEEVDPFFVGPAPEGSSFVGAPQEQERDDIRYGALPMRGDWAVQPGVDDLQRTQQPSDRLPAGRRPVVILQPSQVADTEFGDALYLVGPSLERGVEAVTGKG